MKLVEDFQRISLRDRVVLAVVTLAVILSFVAMIRAATAPSMALLYAGLDASSSGEIVEKLDSMNVRADIKGDAIYVPLNKRDSIRMTLAGAGLPRQGQAGFELFDDINAFATTSDMFDATYWRAKEGELARTILATPGVKTARVHIAVSKRGAFSRGSQAPSAVVTIGMARGKLNMDQAEAARYIIALAVPDLEPEHVAVIDSAGGVILSPGTSDNRIASPDEIHDRELTLEKSLADLLEARVGPGNVRVKVAMEVSSEQSSTFERLLDPQKRILTTRNSSEVQESGTEGGGAVTVASNLPEGDAAVAPNAGRSSRSETSESTKFDVSEKRMETTTPAGAIKRIQVAVLINQPSNPDQQGAAPEPRSAEELAAIKNLVAAAAGIDASRGDIVTVESLAFEQPLSQGEEVTANPALDFLGANLMAILQLVIPAIVALLLALFVLKPILSPRSEKAAASQLSVPLSAPALSPPQGNVEGKPALSPVDEMRRVAAERQTESAKVISNWLETQDTAA